MLFISLEFQVLTCRPIIHIRDVHKYFCDYYVVNIRTKNNVTKRLVLQYYSITAVLPQYYCTH